MVADTLHPKLKDEMTLADYARIAWFKHASKKRSCRGAPITFSIYRITNFGHFIDIYCGTCHRKIRIVAL